MLNNQSIPAPSDSGPVEMVSPPIDWAELMLPFLDWLPDPSIENAFIAALCLLAIPVLWDQHKYNNRSCNDEDLH